MTSLLVALALAFGSMGASPEGRHVQDAIVGFTFVAGSTSLNTPGQPFKVRTGDTVVWTNLDPMSHDVSFDSIEFSAYLRTRATTPSAPSPSRATSPTTATSTPSFPACRASSS